MPEVTVAIPVRDGGALFERVLQALARQTVAHELLVCDSRSRDRSAQQAREHGARVVEIEPEHFSHGGTRNLLMREATGARVAFLTQDAEPADERWLERLLAGFELADDVALVYGSYRPRADASAPVRMELERWFAYLSSDGSARVDRLSEDERKSLPAAALMGPRGFFTDANACISRTAWEGTPFREVLYAEDRVLALDMLRAGYAKAYVPDAAVVHSHDYTGVQELRRCFDEWRGLLEVYGWREPVSPLHLARKLRGELGFARRELHRQGISRSQQRAILCAVAVRCMVRLKGELLGSHADRLPAPVCRRLSLEGRATFSPLDLDAGASESASKAFQGLR
jgi:GT2 family glycosyltransferase